MCKLSCVEVVIVRDSAFVTGTVRFVVRYDLHEVVNGFPAGSAVMPTVIAVIPGGDAFLSFSCRTVSVPFEEKQSVDGCWTRPPSEHIRDEDDYKDCCRKPLGVPRFRLAGTHYGQPRKWVLPCGKGHLLLGLVWTGDQGRSPFCYSAEGRCQCSWYSRTVCCLNSPSDGTQLFGYIFRTPSVRIQMVENE